MKTIDQEIKANIPNVRNRMMVNIIFMSSWIRNRYTDMTKHLGVSVQQVNILRILKGAGEWLSMNVVKERMIEKSPNATRLADKLVSKGYIERKRSEADRRVVFVQITPKGLELLGELEKIEEANPNTFLDDVTEEEAELVNRVLDRMRS
jgi:DNA-binding MarR family transcriptional regulator